MNPITMRPFTFILILTLTTAGIILICSYVDQKYSSSYSSAPSAEPLISKHGADKYKKDNQQKTHPMKAKAEKKHEAGKKFLTMAEGKVPAFEVCMAAGGHLPIAGLKTILSRH